MKVVIQRVNQAEVSIDSKVIGQIEKGLLVLLGFEESDNDDDIEWIVNKVLRMRIFNDEDQKMNLSMNDIHADLLLVSQFTLHASTKKGNRPSFIKAAQPKHAQSLYNNAIGSFCENYNGKIETGKFGAMMEVSLINDGPVTIIMDSKNKN
tara:strand:- start:2777 stop:3229 length:453 start_codon:yes stop_codon:yes gene_type:complete